MEVAAGAVPVDVDVPVIKQRRGVSPTVKCLKFSSSRRLRTFQLCNRDGYSVMHWVAVYGGMAAMKGFLAFFCVFFALLQVVPELGASFSESSMTKSSLSLRVPRANQHRTSWTYTFPRFSPCPKQQQQQQAISRKVAPFFSVGAGPVQHFKAAILDT